MTKEQTAVEWIADRFRQYQIEGYKCNWDEVIETVLLAKEIEQQEVAKEREKAKKLVDLLKEYEQWEADLIADNAMWWPSVPKDRISGKTYDTMLILQNKRNELIKQSLTEYEKL